MCLVYYIKFLSILCDTSVQTLQPNTRRRRQTSVGLIKHHDLGVCWDGLPHMPDPTLFNGG